LVDQDGRQSRCHEAFHCMHAADWLGWYFGNAAGGAVVTEAAGGTVAARASADTAEADDIGTAVRNSA
jgi:hypothetical protein